MSLKRYKEKRDFGETPEPKGIGQRHGDHLLRFCVQKHAARRLHYDLRLEHRGALLSWAVPKGPPDHPGDKRLAIHVEDHPLEYQYFEGVIPKGSYGAGTVEIWDAGVYAPFNGMDKAEAEELLDDGIERGHLSLVLLGKKMAGEYVLHKMKADPADNQWLFIKIGEEQPSQPADEPQKAALPPFFKPMLAVIKEKAFNHKDWLFEIKWDGYRALAFLEGGKVSLLSRNNKLLNAKYKAIVDDLAKFHPSLIFDGEIVVLDNLGRSHFQLIQNYQKKQEGSLFYYIFDLLFIDGEDLRERPLLERKERLKSLLKNYPLPHIRYSDHIVGKGEDLFREALKLELEGIIAKCAGSPYRSRRSADWVKIKATQRQRFIIGGFTAPRGSRRHFGALLVGVYNEKRELEYVGSVGGGFDEALLSDLANALKPLIQDRSPFVNHVDVPMKVTWVAPKLSCDVTFTEWTSDKRLRQPIFLHLC